MAHLRITIYIIDRSLINEPRKDGAVPSKNPSDRHPLGTDYVPKTVKDAILQLLYHAPTPLRFTDIMNGVRRPNRTVYVSLKELTQKGLVSNADHRYSLTSEGKGEYEKKRVFTQLNLYLDQTHQTLGDEKLHSLLEEGGWIWVPRRTSEALEKRAHRDHEPVWSIIDTLLGTTNEETEQKRLTVSGGPQGRPNKTEGG